MITTLPDTFTRREAARRLGVAPTTLKAWAARGVGPTYSRTGTKGGRTIYTADDLARWLHEHKAVSRTTRANG